jgi:hypothetical protein
MLSFECPDCATSKVVKATVFDADFWSQLLLISLPLLAIGAISLVLHGVSAREHGKP